jgi:hypothetical protein
VAELKVPAAMRPVAEQVITLTDKACAELLDEEYADLARHVVGKLARKRPSPLLSGRAATWAGGIVWALGQVNFAFDRESKPHVTHDELAGTFGLSKPTLSNKAKQVRDTLKMSWATPEFLRADVIDSSSMVWFIEIDGFILDARSLPVEIQAQAFAKGIIPYIPALGRDGTAAVLERHGPPPDA